MKSFITLKSPEVYHGDDTVSIGVYGLEGSKPGAAAVGVLLSHRVSHVYEVEHKFNFFCCLIQHTLLEGFLRIKVMLSKSRHYHFNSVFVACIRSIYLFIYLFNVGLNIVHNIKMTNLHQLIKNN